MAKDRKRKRRQLIQQSQRIVEDMLEENILLDFLTDSDEENEKEKQCSQRNPNKEREHFQFHEQLMKDYFNEGSTYDEKDFCRRFRMERPLF
jgi:tRNA G46 methylase TrmB